MRKSWPILLFLLIASAASGAVYKWVDQTGEVHYSDQRMPGAERIDLPKSSIYTPPAKQQQATKTPAARATAAAGSYQSLAISTPGDEETIHSNEQTVNVSIGVQPALGEGHRFRLYLDGNAVSGEHTTPRITLQNVERGSHTLTATVVDQAGKELIRSQPVTFFLRKISLLTFPGRPEQLPELPDSEDDSDPESPEQGEGEEEANGGEEGDSEEDDSEESVRPRPTRPGDNPYAPNFRPNYSPVQPLAR